jgi:HAMP domain-containing protein
MSIGQRLFLILAIPIVGLMLITADMLFEFRAANQRDAFIVDVQVPSLVDLAEIQNLTQKLRIEYRNASMAADAGDVDRSIGEIAVLKGQLQKSFGHYMDADVADDGDRRRGQEFALKLHAWFDEVDAMTALLKKGQRGAAAGMLTGPLFERSSAVRVAFDDWLQYNRLITEKAGRDNIVASAGAVRRLAVSAVLVLVASVALAYLLARRFARQLRRIAEAAEQVVTHDRSVAIPFLDDAHEIGTLARSVSVLRGFAIDVDDQRWIT